MDDKLDKSVLQFGSFGKFVSQTVFPQSSFLLFVTFDFLIPTHFVLISCEVDGGLSLIDLFTVFSTFDMDKLGKICRHQLKERLKISKIA